MVCLVCLVDLIVFVFIMCHKMLFAFVAYHNDLDNVPFEWRRNNNIVLLDGEIRITHRAPPVCMFHLVHSVAQTTEIHAVVVVGSYPRAIDTQNVDLVMDKQSLSDEVHCPDAVC